MSKLPEWNVESSTQPKGCKVEIERHKIPQPEHQVRSTLAFELSAQSHIANCNECPNVKTCDLSLIATRGKQTIVVKMKDIKTIVRKRRDLESKAYPQRRRPDRKR